MEKILDYSKFVSEKLNISPVSKERLRKLQTWEDVKNELIGKKNEYESALTNIMGDVFDDYENILCDIVKNGFSQFTGFCGKDDFNTYIVIGLEDYFKPLMIGKDISEPFTDAVMNPIPLSKKKIAEFKKIGIEIDGTSLKITEVFFSNMKLYVDDNKDKYIKGFDYKSEMQETPFDVWFYAKYDPRRNANFETFARMFLDGIWRAVNDFAIESVSNILK